MSITYRVPKTNLFAVTANTNHQQQERLHTIDWTFVRKARPLDEPLPATQRWVNSLPIEIRPIELETKYPRITNRLAIAWKDPKAVDEVLDDVLVDRRGGRRGFPPTVLGELLRLRLIADGR